MLSLVYNDKKIENSIVGVVPDSDEQIPGLREMLRNNFMVLNPAKAFADKFKSGGYNDCSDDQIAKEAQIANILSDAWIYDSEVGGVSQANIVSVFTRLCEMVLEANGVET